MVPANTTGAIVVSMAAMLERASVQGSKAVDFSKAVDSFGRYLNTILGHCLN